MISDSYINGIGKKSILHGCNAIVLFLILLNEYASDDVKRLNQSVRYWKDKAQKNEGKQYIKVVS